MATEDTGSKTKATGRKRGRPPKKAAAEQPPPAPSPEPTDVEDPIDDVAFDFNSLVNILVPPTSIEIVDAFGNEHKVSSAISARSQIVLFRIVEDIQKCEAVMKIAGNGSVSNAGGVASALMYLGGDEEVMGYLAEAFEVAHPRAYAEACKSAEEQGVKVEDAADCFSVEELVSAIVPLFLRLIKRTAQAANVMQGAQVQSN